MRDPGYPSLGLNLYVVRHTCKCGGLSLRRAVHDPPPAELSVPVRMPVPVAQSRGFIPAHAAPISAQAYCL
ncbi:MAG: hypothetical protein RIS85_468 [Pseudomonadota bacterium]|jgi:hypothetical protein